MFYLFCILLIFIQFYLLGIAISAIYYSLKAFENDCKLEAKEYFKDSLLWGLVIVKKFQNNKNEIKDNF